MFEFKLPDLGEGIHEGELLQWHVAVGDTVKEDDPLCEMETDKAAVTIPSPRAGVISALNASPGDTVDVGSVFVVIDDGSGDAAAKEKAAQEEASDTAPQEKNASRPDPPSEQRPKGRVLAAPATRRLAREMGIDITQVSGSGPGGRVTPEDLNAYDGADAGPDTAENPEDTAAEDRASEPKAVAEPLEVSGIPFLEVQGLATPDGPVEREPFRSLRNKVAVKMTSSSILMPHVAHMDDIDVTDIEAQRLAYNLRQADKSDAGREETAEKNPGKLTLLAFVMKAVAAGLKDYPMFNASVDLSSREIVYKKYYNIGFAADTPRGLMVPVVHDADRQSLAGVGYRIRHLAGLARNGEISVPELTGGTFTITNVGAIGGTHVFPIINAPESAILGLGRVEKRPVVVGDDKIRVRKILPVTLCFDHRVADGAQAAAFVRDLKDMLENRLEFMSRI
ncbi:MAG TPA: hypothetical protein DHV36_11415 [Desulfobacteraceae bacterium]|nr:hypothetical protein [Desulfobacteraceae bacterium]